MHPILVATANTLQFNTGLVALGVDDLDDATARRRLQGGFNSPAFLLGHLLSGRHGMARLVGLEVSDPWPELFGTDVAATDGDGYPPMAELLDRWRSLSADFLARLDQLDEAALLAAAAAGPSGDTTVRGALGFWTWHECYHVGQLGMVRARMGLGTIKDRFYHQRQAARAG